MKGNWLLVCSVILLAHTAHGCPDKCLCYTASKTADCKNRGFTEIPARLPPEIQILTGNITLLSLKHNKLQKMERILLESLPNLKVVLFKDNPWQCNCNIFGMKLWLESFLYRGGISDGIICSAPGIRKGKDLLKVPYELFGACPLRTAQVHLASSHHHSLEHRSPLKHGHPGELGDSGRASCEPKAKARPVSLRHAIATVVITGVVCGIVCLMMLAAAVYGCAYAAITAKYHKEHLAPAKQHGTPKGKEPFESSLA
uniref:Leucine rich repeats and transmembrane domains 1 n=1 Tax=Cyanistes caeruleus TaxID=156563 RepID=A0A8C0VWK9_CYACU